MFFDFKKWVKSIQTAGYNGARTIYKLEKKLLEKTILDFKKWVKSIQTAGYNGARTILVFDPTDDYNIVRYKFVKFQN